MKIFYTICLVLFCSVSVAQMSADEYVASYKDNAIEKMNLYGVPASIILAVAMHESANGNSKIARNLNNHFGIKGRNTTRFASAYKSFDSPAESYDYFISVLQNRKQFNKLFSAYTHYDYRNWALGIQRGGYAASRTWASQVMGTIRRYKLYEYDNRPADYAEPVYKPTYTAKKPSSSKTYVVKKGDNLNAIAERHGTTALKLKAKNGLKSIVLQPGQKLKL
jgi:hypothetical protein